MATETRLTADERECLLLLDRKWAIRRYDGKLVIDSQYGGQNRPMNEVLANKLADRSFIAWGVITPEGRAALRAEQEPRG